VPSAAEITASLARLHKKKILLVGIIFIFVMFINRLLFFLSRDKDLKFTKKKKNFLAAQNFQRY
jgi:hypothetical protein